MNKNSIATLCISLLIALPACMCDKEKSCCNKSTPCETTTTTPANTESPVETAVEIEHVHTDKDQTAKF